MADLKPQMSASALVGAQQVSSMVNHVPTESPRQHFCDLSLEKAGRISPSTVSVTSVTSSSFDPSLAVLPLQEDSIGHWMKKDSVETSACESTNQLDREGASILIQAVFRSWFYRMKGKIERLKNLLEEIREDAEYSLDVIEEQTKRERERCKRTMKMVEQRNLRKSERDLMAAQQLVEDLKAENKKIRQQNKGIVKKIEEEQKKHKELRDDLFTTQKCMTLVSAQMPRLKQENKAARNAASLFEDRKKEYDWNLFKVSEFLCFEKKVTVRTRDVIFEMLTHIREVSEDRKTAKEIFKMGVDRLENVKMLANELKDQARQKEKQFKEGANTPTKAKARSKSAGRETEKKAVKTKSQRSLSQGRADKGSAALTTKGDSSNTARGKTPSKSRGKTPSKARASTPAKIRSLLDKAKDIRASLGEKERKP